MHFISIVKVVGIRIGIAGIGAVLILFKVGQAIRIRIKGGIMSQGVQIIADFPTIRHAVRVRVGAAIREHRCPRWCIRALIDVVGHPIQIGIDFCLVRAPFGINRYTGKRISTLIRIIHDTIAVRICLR